MANTTVLVLVLLVLMFINRPSHIVHARWAEVLPTETVDTEEQKEELMGVLHNVLDHLEKKRMAILERKFSRLPGVCKRLRRRIITILCNVGDFCSVNKGAQHGQLCRCPRGSKCSHFFLKCL